MQLCWVCWVDRWTAPHWHDHLHNLARLRDHARGGAIPLPRICLSLADAGRALLCCDKPLWSIARTNDRDRPNACVCLDRRRLTGRRWRGFLWCELGRGAWWGDGGGRVEFGGGRVI